MRAFLLVALAAALVALLLPEVLADEATEGKKKLSWWSRAVAQHAANFAEIREADRRSTDCAVQLLLGSPRIAMANWTGLVTEENLGPSWGSSPIRWGWAFPHLVLFWHSTEIMGGLPFMVKFGLFAGGIGTDVLLIIALFLAPVECMTQYVKYQAATVFATMLYYYMYPYIPWIFCDLAFYAACMAAVGVSISHSAPLILLALQKIAKKTAMKKTTAPEELSEYRIHALVGKYSNTRDNTEVSIKSDGLNVSIINPPYDKVMAVKDFMKYGEDDSAPDTLSLSYYSHKGTPKIENGTVRVITWSNGSIWTKLCKEDGEIAKKEAMKKKVATHPDFANTMKIVQMNQKNDQFQVTMGLGLVLHDKNGDGLLDKDELANLVAATFGKHLTDKKQQAEFVDVVFDMCDSNSDGKIDLEELQLVFAVMADMALVSKVTSATEWAAIRSGQSKKAN